MVNKEEIMSHFSAILDLAGFDIARADILRTPERQWEVLEYMTRGFEMDVTLERMYEDYGDDFSNLRICPSIEYVSVCEHHFIPFFGKVDIAYLPNNGKVTGLSKLPQLVQKYALRPQLQEKMTDQIADELMKRCCFGGVMVIAEGQHTCEMVEGFRRDKPYITSSVRGLFGLNPYLKQEALALLAR